MSTQNDAYFIADKYQIHASQLVSCIATPAKDTAILKNHIDHEFSRLIAAGNPNPILMGAIPFDTQQNSSLSFYTESTKSCLDDLFDSKPQEFNVHQVKSSVSEQDFKELVEHALDTIEKTALSKVVLSRMLQLEIDSAPNVASLVKILVEKNPQAYTFAVPVSDTETIVGVSPELLLSKEGHRVKSNPLAGSLALTKNLKQDLKNKTILKSSPKDQREHSLVVDKVVSHLAPYCSSLTVTETPEILETSTMLHLSTVLNGTLRHNAPDALTLALNLHPTPAICGTPTEQAKQFIQSKETYERGFYSGLIGWMDTQGNGEWLVTIRCGLLESNHMSLYAGAGVVAGSCPDSEWIETQKKLETMLNVFTLHE
ncbi:hypothetical protein AK822_04100 [Psychrobacter sp. P11F6]|nr:hypothetical protein AK822_04100 [Psychrobacter sp. P11F6]